MPRFFMHQRSGEIVIADLEGGQYVDLADAMDDAKQAAREIMAQRVLAGKPLGHSVFQITDDAGRIVNTMPFQTALADLAIPTAPRRYTWVDEEPAE